MSKWVSKPLGDLITLQRGHDLPSQKRQLGKIPIMGSSGITGYHSEVKATGPGVVVGRSGNSMGEVSYSPVDYWPLNTCLYVTDFKGNDEQYIYYLLKTIDFDQFNSGSAQKSLNRNAVYPYEVKTTECKVEQKKIGNILADLENKVELNCQTNQALEQIAQALFKSWFVDFEPTRAKIAAKQARQDPERAAMAAISGKAVAELEQLGEAQLAQLKTTAALFPDGLVESELGEVPEGWEVGSIGCIASAKGGYAYKGKLFSKSGHPVVKIKNITGDNRIDISDTAYIGNEYAESTERFKLSDGNLLMAMTGATVGKMGLVVTGRKSVYLNQRVARFESTKFGNKISWFLFCCFKHEPIISALIDTAQGSAQPNISSTGIESTRLVLPPDKLITLFCEKAEPLFNKWISNISENSSLEELRDTLLPKLLSGELSPTKTEAA